MAATTGPGSGAVDGSVSRSVSNPRAVMIWWARVLLIPSRLATWPNDKFSA